MKKKKKGVEPSWPEAFANAIRRGRFTKQDISRAGDWSRCAVGEAPRRITGVKFAPLDKCFAGPTDSDLGILGNQFLRDVEAHQIGPAVTTYRAVQERVKEIRATRRTNKEQKAA